MIKKGLLWIRCLIGYTFYASGSILFIICFLPAAFLLLPFGALSKRLLSAAMHYYLAFLTRVFLPALKIYTIKEIYGFEHLHKAKSTVIVVNHRGKLDGPLLLGLLKNTVALMKVKYTIHPVYATLVKQMDFISFNPHSRNDIEKTVGRIKEVLGKGKNLLTFPEGTRTSSKRLLPFRELAFRIAQEMNTSIVPIVIYSDIDFMTRHFKSFFPKKKNSFVIRCLPPVSPLPEEPAATLAARVRKIMVKEFAEIEKTYG